MMDAAVSPEIDALGQLERRIVEAAEQVSRFRREAAAAQERAAALAREVDELRRERQQVRSRIEKLLARLDELGAA